MKHINRLVLDATGSITDMCSLGSEFGTDKSPYSTTWHHHPYTAIYDLLFANLRYVPLVFGELGILDNKSMHMWRAYFAQAELYGFEFFEDKILAAKQQMIPGAHYAKADVSDRASLFHAFNGVGKKFDILIDDSTHFFEHQILFAEVAVDFVKPGGMIIIEDVFRGWNEERYLEAMESVLPFFGSASFIETNHEKAFSGGNSSEPYFDNDKLLVFHRNEVVRFGNDLSNIK